MTVIQTTHEIDSSRLQAPSFAKLERKIRGAVGRAVSDFGMIEAGDRVMVCVSGGADSYTMLDILLTLQKSAPVDFELIAVNLDQKQPDFPEHILPAYLRELGVDFRIVEEDTYSVVKRLVPEGKTTCSLCSRLRRGVLYNTAAELGANKIALGHHGDDIVETLFLNLFFNSRLKAMPAKLQSDDGRNVVIRPLAYLRESLIKQYAELRDFPIFPAICVVRSPIHSDRKSRPCWCNGTSYIPVGWKTCSVRSVGCRLRICSIVICSILSIQASSQSSDGHFCGLSQALESPKNPQKKT